MDDAATADDDDGILSLTTTNQIHHQLSSTGAARGRPRHCRLQKQWCVAKPNQAATTLQGDLDWACGPLQGQGQVDCSPIRSTGACYNPNTLEDHCNWAFNAYYLLHSNLADPCEFAGSAVLTTIDPSKKISTPDSLISPSSLSKKWDSSFCISVMCFPVFGLVAF
ncbi:unnamed protein product [Sphagnum balticum]